MSVESIVSDEDIDRILTLQEEGLTALEESNRTLADFNPEYEQALISMEVQFEQNTQRVNNLRQEILDLFARMRKLKKTIEEKANK